MTCLKYVCLFAWFTSLNTNDITAASQLNQSVKFTSASFFIRKQINASLQLLWSSCDGQLH